MFFKIVGRLTIQFFQKLGRTTIKSGRFLVRRPVASFFIVAVLVGAGALLWTTNFLGIASSDSGLVSTAEGVQGSGKESSVIVLKGLSAYNAAQMWQGFSDDYRQSLIRNGMDQNRLQQLLDETRKQNQENGEPLVYEKFTFQGFWQLQDGSGSADSFQSTIKTGTSQSIGRYLLRIDSKERVREVLSDDPLLAKTLFSTTVRSSNPVVRPGDGSVRVLIGMMRGDSKEIWNGLSDDYRQQLTESGLDQNAIQAALDKSLKDNPNKVEYDHFTLRGTQGDTSIIEQYAGYVKNSSASQYTYNITLDERKRVTQISSNDPVIRSVFLDTMVQSSDPSVKPRTAGSQVLQGIAKFNAKPIWNSLSEEYKKALTSEGYNEAAMQKSIDTSVKELETLNEKPTYVKFELSQVGQTRDTGSLAEIYSVSYQLGGRVSSTVFVIKYDQSEKVSEVIAQDPIVSAALRKPKSSTTQPQVGSETLAPNFVAERLMIGLTTFDTQKIWASFSETYQRELRAKGITPSTMATELNNFKSDATKQNLKLGYVGYSFVSGKSYPAGNSETSYVSTLQYGDRAGQFEYLIILDSNNKIQAITTTDPILSAMLGRSQQQGQ
jgi:hypothetical protein